jgi:Terminase large subunit, T4likevirus-type, N-terminal
MSNVIESISRAFNDYDIFERNKLVPDDWQKQLLQSEKNTLVCVTRQGGKSLAVCAKAVHHAATRMGSLILIAAPSDRQVRELIRLCADLIIGAGYGNELRSKQVTSLEFKGGSRIIGVPGTVPQNVRGYSDVSVVVVDEAAFVPDEFFTAVSPMLAVSQGQLICLSTPAGRRGYFWNQWANNSESWERIEVLATLINRIPKEFLEQERKTLGDAIFGAEYLCKFSSEDGGFISQENVMQRVQDVPLLGERGERKWIFKESFSV